MQIDPSYDVRTDAGGKDPDSYSATLRSYHRFLWSKPLPGGAMFDLDERLHHRSALGEFWLGSDSIGHTYSHWGRPARLAAITALIPESEMTAFRDLANTVGGYMVFPPQTRKPDGGWWQSINQARGMNGKIRDRFDLTLECIRRHYIGEPSPLSAALAPYADFFSLFETFRGYTDFFLLQDLVDERGDVRFWVPFDDFARDALPASSVAEYREYEARVMAFIQARNARMAAWEDKKPQVLGE